MATAPDPLSGRQFLLEHGPFRAAIASIGASLRALTHDGRDLVVPYAADELRPAFRGAILAPWPNRVVDGRYTDGVGVEQRLALTEPDRGHALHGLVGWHDFAAVDAGSDHVGLFARIPAQGGYPHQVDVTVDYRLDATGLTTTVTGSNVGSTVAPWGTGPHPYLVAGSGRVDAWELELPAHSVLTVTADRLIPLATADVATVDGGYFDFRTRRALAGVEIDHAYTDLHRDPDGLTTVRVLEPGGQGVAMVFDTVCPWIQIHTADRPEPENDRLGLAVEPMTCAPDAFNSGVGLIRLEPGQSHTAGWRIDALTAAG